MTARIIDGRAHAKAIRTEVAAEVEKLSANGIRLHLVAIAVGEDQAIEMYGRRQAKQCAGLGIEFTLKQLPSDIDETEFLGYIKSLNYNPEITAILLFLPLPDHIDTRVAQAAIDPGKDVEGVSAINLGRLYNEPGVIAPCTAAGIITLLDREGIDLPGTEVTLVGASSIVGRALLLLLLHRMATPTVCHIDTRDVALHTRQADVVVVAAGKPGLITGDMIRPGATVIDVGINDVVVPDESGNQVRRTVGDVDFDSVVEVAGALTPVPGGVGPMTVATLVSNIVRCYHLEKRRWW